MYRTADWTLYDLELLLNENCNYEVICIGIELPARTIGVGWKITEKENISTVIST